MTSFPPSITNRDGFHSDLTSNLITEVSKSFEQRFSRRATNLVAAPGRVNLIGEHIDYNDGFALPMAVDRYVVIAAALNSDRHQPATVYSADLDEVATIGLDKKLTPQDNGWLRYIEGVLAGYQQLGFDIPSFNAIIRSNIPIGAGLSSSAALEVAAATLVESLVAKSLDPVKKARLCQQAEHAFAGVPCGILDQVSSIFGKPDELMLLDCNTEEIHPVPLTDDDVTVLITNSHVKHKHDGGEYAKRRQQCDSALTKLKQSSWRAVSLAHLKPARDVLTPTEFCRARHVVTEIARTTEAAQAFELGDWKRVGELMYASHESLREDFEVSCPELDVLVELAQSTGAHGGVFGSRMTGGGFGGCTVTLLKTGQVAKISEMLMAQYKARTGLEASCFASRPARGAHVIQASSVAK